MKPAGIELELAALFCFVFLSVLRLSDWSIIYVTQNSSENCFSDPNMQKVGEIHSMHTYVHESFLSDFHSL